MGYEEDFKGKTALVTGGSRGIGKEVAIALQRYGAIVTILGRSATNLQQVVDEFPNIVTICLDISDWDATKKALAGKKYDFLVNNAGVLNYIDFLDMGPQDFDFVMNTNLKALINVSQCVAKGMIEDSLSDGGDKKKRNRAIVNLSSTASKKSFAHFFVYNMSKAALDMATKSMAQELGRYGVRVNSVNPAEVTTDMAAAMREDFKSRGYDPEKMMTPPAARIYIDPNGDKLISIDQVVESVLFFLSSSSAHITGQHLFLDNGFLLS